MIHVMYINYTNMYLGAWLVHSPRGCKKLKISLTISYHGQSQINNHRGCKKLKISLTQSQRLHDIIMRVFLPLVLGTNFQSFLRVVLPPERDQCTKTIQMCILVLGLRIDFKLILRVVLPLVWDQCSLLIIRICILMLGESLEKSN